MEGGGGGEREETGILRRGETSLKEVIIRRFRQKQREFCKYYLEILNF